MNVEEKAVKNNLTLIALEQFYILGTHEFRNIFNFYLMHCCFP